MTQKNISRQFAMVADGLHRGAGILKNKNIPDGSGNITMASSLGFLYRNKEKMLTSKKTSMLLSVLNAEKGLDSVKRRLNSYGLFGKQSQNNPEKKFTYQDVETIFVYGANISKYQAGKLDDIIAALERSLGDTEATAQNHKKSPKYKEALDKAETMSILVVGHYDESFFSQNEDDDSIASLSLGYVEFGTGRIPIVSSFEHPTGKDALVEAEWFGKKAKDYILDTEGSISLVTTRSYLKDFKGSEFSNLRSFPTKDDPKKSFWSVIVADFTPEELPAEFAVSFSEETRKEMMDATKVRIQYVPTERDTRIIEDVLASDKKGDAVVCFSGFIEDDIEDYKRIDIYKSEPDEEGQVKKYVTIKVRRGTFFTIKNI